MKSIISLSPDNNCVRRNYIILLAGLLLLFAVSSCQKDGNLVKAASVTMGSVSLISQSDNQYIVMVDGRRMGDTISNGRGIHEAIVEIKDSKQHFVIQDISAGFTLIDTLISLPSPAFTYLLLQLDPAGRPMLFSNKDDESIPGADSAKIRFIYTDPNLPDSMKMRYYYIDGNTVEYELFDSSIIYKKEIDNYITGSLLRYPGGLGVTMFGFELIDAKTGNILQPLDLDPASSKFAQGVMDQAPVLGGILRAKKQTLLLEFGGNSYLNETYKERYLFGSDE